MKTTLLLITLLCLLGCSGATSSDGAGAGGGNETEAQREADFREEGIQRALDVSIITCEEIQCPLADAEDGVDFVPLTGRFNKECIYNCVDSEIDTSGEVRQYWVFLAWSRLENGCWERTFNTVATPQRDLCLPTF